ncbi:hypothetical protein LGL55_16495 [Clostridium tagluense]|uniref:hypothetical protein n=1 Tax=Clostridium tagluense TaxID=360422 RepID=UPI001CF1ADF0|nr:hypothetical protein [Clostridium tagluense]MCB2312860.1 hypothetical protein [Clostridium tagluense]MCB2317626.1 hypothetical protein [Clostridium tagluense]MCB2322417.1 hypothetical protein [Clostridium tagluense]MCB2327420.1 hypothetical protein [Clostridium tagluense]MCB2332128.1 hypothetical protein [Clostridium tagluense]
MSPKDTPYPFDGMPDENCFGEFRELVSSTGAYVAKENNHHDKDNNDPDDTFNEFSIFPKV